MSDGLYHYLEFSSCNFNLMLDAFVSLPRVLKLEIQPNIQFTTDGLWLTILWELLIHLQASIKEKSK
jgi:hypothetical protein